MLRLRPAAGSEWRPVSIEMLKASQANEKKDVAQDLGQRYRESLT